MFFCHNPSRRSILRHLESAEKIILYFNHLHLKHYLVHVTVVFVGDDDIGVVGEGGGGVVDAEGEDCGLRQEHQLLILCSNTGTIVTKYLETTHHHLV